MIIKSTTNIGEIEFSEQEGLQPSGGSEYYVVALRGNGLAATRRVYAFDPYNYNLAKFFAELAQNWKGWEGQKKWTSLEGELAIICESDSTGHVYMTVKLQNGPYQNNWIVEQALVLDAGQLDYLAADAKKFFNT